MRCRRTSHSTHATDGDRYIDLPEPKRQSVSTCSPVSLPNCYLVLFILENLHRCCRLLCQAS